MATWVKKIRMAYSDFTLKRIKSELNISIIANRSLFAETERTELTDYLHETLKRNLPLAMAINTEKARSELIIINILLEIRTRSDDKISLFSGIDFTVDKDKGLNGYCDFIISNSSEQLYLECPVIMIVEAKNENISSGLGQCIAEMYAADLFNKKEENRFPSIYGAVTTGDEWKFIKLSENTAYIDIDTYYINDIQKIVAILTEMTMPIRN